MLRVALSIKAGRISAATILRRLGTYSRRNRLYQAFRELGRVVRTVFLLRYLHDPELRAKIQAATNKSEAFNGFVKWLNFGGEGVIAENDRDRAREAHQVQPSRRQLLDIPQRLLIDPHRAGPSKRRGEVPEDALACISPYLTEHINRFGDYTLNMDRKPPQADYGFALRQAHAQAG